MQSKRWQCIFYVNDVLFHNYFEHTQLKIMKSAYLYVRVSTDEQKKKGFSLIEQEDRLLKYCEMNQVMVKGIFREDFSAKDFN
jgi:hypothetical protein